MTIPFSKPLLDSNYTVCCLIFKLFDLPFSKLASFLTSYETGKIVLYQVKVKSVYKPSGPSCWNLSQFAKHKATRSISTPPWMGC